MNGMKTELAFWDTSALVPLCCARGGPSNRSRELLRRFTKPVVWWGTEIEVYSALARLHKEAALTERALDASIKRWEQFQKITREIVPVEQVRQVARRLPAQYRIRTLDSFQIAAALVWCQENPRRRPFVCFDRPLAIAAEKAGFSVFSESPSESG